MTKFMKAKKSVDFNISNTNTPSDALIELINDPRFGMDLKCDGTRAVFEFDEKGIPMIYGRGTVQKELHSQERIQREYNQQFPELVLKIPELALSTIDTEITITNPETGLEDYNILQTRANRKSDISLYAQRYPATVRVFDVQQYNGEDLTGKALLERQEVLADIFLLGKKLQNMKRLPFGTDPTSKRLVVQEAMQTGGEGVMVKDLEAVYKDGRGGWIKAKRTHTEDVFVLGMSEGNGKFAPYFGQLHCYQMDDEGDINFVCAVGGGFSFVEMEQIRNFYGGCFDRPHHNQSDMKVRYEMLKSTGHILVIEIKHYGIVKTGRRHPVFLRIRLDKDAEECIGKDSAGNDQLSLEEFI